MFPGDYGKSEATAEAACRLHTSEDTCTGNCSWKTPPSCICHKCDGTLCKDSEECQMCSIKSESGCDKPSAPGCYTTADSACDCQYDSEPPGCHFDPINYYKNTEGLCDGIIYQGETCQGNCYSDLVKTTNGTSSPYCLNGSPSCSPPPKTCTQIVEEATQEATQSYPTLTNEDILSAVIIKEAADKCEQEGGSCKGFVVPKPELVMIEGGLGGIARS